MIGWCFNVSFPFIRNSFSNFRDFYFQFLVLLVYNIQKGFDLTVTWLAKYLPRSAVANFMRIDWQTVGSCISRSLHDLEPERFRRLDGLVRIGIDETSYRKGHKYITVIVNHDTNTVTGDGARWITDCVNEFTPDCERCVDPFDVVEWAMEALDEVRRDRWRAAYEKAKQLAAETPLSRIFTKNQASQGAYS